VRSPPGRPSRHPASLGQASLEWVVVTALVSVVLGAAAAVTAPPPLAESVARTVRRGICIVAGGDCWGRDGPRPCVVRALERRRDARAALVVLRFGDGRVLLREVRSDGTVAVTVVQSARAGVGVQGGGEVRLGGRGVHVGIDVEGGGEGSYGRTFVVAGPQETDRLIARLHAEDPRTGGAPRALARLVAGRADPGPRADVRSYELGVRGEAEPALRALGLGAHAELVGRFAYGLRVDDRTGEHTVLLRVDAALTGRLTAPLVRFAGGLPSDAVVALTLDRRGEPVRLHVQHRRGIEGAIRADDLSGRGGDRLEAEARLELTDRAARDDVLGALRGWPPHAARTARRLAEDGRLDVRVYETTRGAESTRGAMAGLVARLGAEVVRTSERSRLVAAHGRDPGGEWGPNLDCAAAA